MSDHFRIPPEERLMLDRLPPTCESLYRAWSLGRLYGRGECHGAISSLPSVFEVVTLPGGVERMTFDGPHVEVVGPDTGDAA